MSALVHVEQDAGRWVVSTGATHVFLRECDSWAEALTWARRIAAMTW
jgi:hypothetical protein